ncbi:MAG: 4Fe-4S dicluster domain-containing protein [Thermodesulfobacteriota bacterium]
MFFTYSFYTASAICILGILYKIWQWFSSQIGGDAGDYSVGQRMATALRGIFRTVFSLRIFKLLYTMVVDVVFQFRILKISPLRWVMHFSIFAGFVLLLLMHALEDEVSRSLFSVYEPTINPYMFLRNLFGFMVVVGLGIAVYRRYANPALKSITGLADKFVLVLLAVIMGSGFFLEAAKIISPTVFYEMTADYAGYYEDSEGIEFLEAYWAKEYGMAFPGKSFAYDDETMAEGRFMNENYCAHCHAKPESAFVSYPISAVLKPAAGWLDRMDAVSLLWYLHFLTCFVGLALLPFTKLFHIVSTPVSLLVNGAGRLQPGQSSALVNRRSVDLDGCTHCGICTLHCSVAPVFRCIDNDNILPSERLAALKQMTTGKAVSSKRLNVIAEGSFICTQCYRCTQLCPAGIDLQDIWLSSRKALEDRGFGHPGTWVPAQLADTASVRQHPERIGGNRSDMPGDLMAVAISRSDFSECLKCKTCTNSCPVVACYDEPKAALDLLPHQMMHALSLGLEDIVIESRMIWSCTTCYQCQEHCPQGVKITDIFFGLKNLAYHRAKAETRPEVRQNGPPVCETINT